jgi:RHH-type transcriptional regulator, rel operon repressor / antitoxin RelB
MSLPQRNEKEFMSFRFRKGLKAKLDALAQATGRSKTFLAEEALEAYCDLHAWQVNHINQGLADADAGHLYTTQQVLDTLTKHD